jgi:hypothetical protein
MKANQSSPATIRLEVHQREVSLTQMVKALADPLLRDFPIIQGLNRMAPRTRTNDFRDAVLAGLTVMPPQNEAERLHIRQVLKAELELRQQRLAKCEEGTIAAALALLKVGRIDETDLNAPLHSTEMREYVSVTVSARIRKMLEDDVTAGRLVVNSIGGKNVVELDRLVEWAATRKVVVEQDALPGCQALVQAAYRRLHERWNKANRAETDSTADSPDTTVTVTSAATTSGRAQENTQLIPGEQPKTTVGRLAVRAAWQIEMEENRQASAHDVMLRLQQWADEGKEDDVLQEADRANRGVIWRTAKYRDKLFSLEACGTTLNRWNKSRI